jgi:hypothetical protein
MRGYWKKSVMVKSEEDKSAVICFITWLQKIFLLQNS